MIDILGHPIRKGDTVLTNGYWTTQLELQVVEKVTKKAVYVSVLATMWDSTQKRRTTEPKSMRRKPSQVVVVNQQIKYNTKTYPENML